MKDIYTCLMTGAALVIIPTKLFSVPPVLLDYLCNKACKYPDLGGIGAYAHFSVARIEI